MSNNSWPDVDIEQVNKAYETELAAGVSTDPDEILETLFKSIKLMRRYAMVVTTQAPVSIAANVIDLAFQDVVSTIKISGEIVTARGQYRHAQEEQGDNNEDED